MTINMVPRNAPDIHLGVLQQPFVSMRVETRPLLLEEHRCASHVGQDAPELR